MAAMITGSFASYKDDFAGTGKALPATRMTLPVTRVTMTILPVTLYNSANYRDCSEIT
jgi:hypothetical protein